MIVSTSTTTFIESDEEYYANLERKESFKELYQNPVIEEVSDKNSDTNSDTNTSDNNDQTENTNDQSGGKEESFKSRALNIAKDTIIRGVITKLIGL